MIIKKIEEKKEFQPIKIIIELETEHEFDALKTVLSYHTTNTFTAPARSDISYDRLRRPAETFIHSLYAELNKISRE